MSNIKPYKILSIICFLSIFFALVLIIRSQAKGYELSIYTNINPLVWLLLIGSMFGGLCIIILYFDKSDWWMIGFLIIVLDNFIILSLPALRGYFMYNSQDPLSHLRITHEIIISGYADKDNFYPILHIFLSNISILSNISPIIRYVPTFLTLLNMMYIYLMAKVLFQDKLQQFFVLISASVPLSGYLNVSAYPEGLGFFMLPLVFYLYFKTSKLKNPGYRVLLIILLLTYPFIHPRSSLILIGFLVVMEIGKIIFDKNITKFSGEYILISVIAFFSWLSIFSIFGTKLRSAYEVLKEGINIDKDPHIVSMTNSIQLEGIDILKFVLKTEGHIILYVTITFISILIIMNFFIRNKNKKEIENLVLLIIWIILGEILVYMFFVSFRTSVFTRAINSDILILLTPIFVGFGLYEFYKKYSNNKPEVVIIVVFIIMISITISIFGLYKSPYTYQINWQVTYEDVEGIDWLVANGIPLSYSGLGLPARDFISSMNGKKLMPNKDIIDHFGYDKFNRMGMTINDYYFTITKRFKLVNENYVLKKTVLGSNDLVKWWNFNGNDFKRLNRDNTVYQIYNNGEFDIFLIKSII